MKTLIFDLDDTLFDTSLELRRRLKDDHGFDVEHANWLDDRNTNGLVSQIANDGSYMSTAPLFQPLLTLPMELSKYRNLGGKIGVCTHRGFHKNAAELTRPAFERYGLIFDDEHYLCPTQQLCKVTYLDGVYGKGNYTLFDDNPKGKHVVRIDEPNVILIDRPYNKHVISVNRVAIYQIPNIVSSLAIGAKTRS